MCKDSERSGSGGYKTSRLATNAETQKRKPDVESLGGCIIDVEAGLAAYCLASWFPCLRLGLRCSGQELGLAYQDLRENGVQPFPLGLRSPGHQPRASSPQYE